MKNRVTAHPWMTLAMALSIAVPVGVSLVPPEVSEKAGIDAVWNDLPIPTIIEFHDDDAKPLTPEVAASKASIAFRDGLSTPGNPRTNASSALSNPTGPRFAAFDAELDNARGVEVVGSNRPATMAPRGAWLTGGIEEAPLESLPRAVSNPRRSNH